MRGEPLPPAPPPSAEFRQQAITHLDTLYNFALRLTKRPPDADDLVQETYLRAFRFSHRFEPGTHLRAWLFQILRNTFLTFYRRETHQPVLLDRDLEEGLEEPAGSGVLDPTVVTMLDLERALAELPEEFRSVLLLADLEGLALQEIGQIMDTPIGTVKSRLFRARRMVRRRLGDYRRA
jgi:RNA polymerase sigma-70 factor (ECF subfamily)